MRTFLALFVWWAVGCSATSTVVSDRPVPPPVAVETGHVVAPVVDQTSELRKALETAQAARDSAIGKADRLAQLQAEKDIAQASERLATAEAAEANRRAEEWHRQAGQKDVEIAAERTREQQVFLWWFAGVLGFAALVAIGVGIWLPLLRRWAWGFAAAAGALASVVLVVAQLLPYAMWAGGALLVVGGIAALVWARRSHVANVQVARAINAIKGDIPDYKTKLRVFFDEATDQHFNDIRKLL